MGISHVADDAALSRWLVVVGQPEFRCPCNAVIILLAVGAYLFSKIEV